MEDITIAIWRNTENNKIGYCYSVKCGGSPEEISKFIEEMHRQMMILETTFGEPS
jgi:hypothetical protein